MVCESQMVKVMNDVKCVETKPSKHQRVFKDPEPDASVLSASKKKFAPMSRVKIQWAVNMYSQWCVNRINNGLAPDEIVKSNLDLVFDLRNTDLCFALSRFIREVKKLDGSEYPPNTLREIIIMVQMYLNENGIYWKLLEGSDFVSLRNVVDNTMKERHADGLGV